jgi:protein SCO1/2
MKTTIPVLITSLLLGGRLLAADTLAPSGASTPPREEPNPAACCAPEAKADAKDACCSTPVDAAPFSAKSLYQTDVAFADDSGRAFRLGELRGRPVVLTMFFASCGYACPLLVSDMQAIRAKLPAGVRERAAFVLVSFDVERDTPAALAAYRQQRALGDDWILLHGDDDAVRELAALIGVKYKQEAGGGFAHSNVITLLNREGEVSYQRSGLKGGLDETAAALVVAAGN